MLLRHPQTLTPGAIPGPRRPAAATTRTMTSSPTGTPVRAQRLPVGPRPAQVMVSEKEPGALLAQAHTTAVGALGAISSGRARTAGDRRRMRAAATRAAEMYRTYLEGAAPSDPQRPSAMDRYRGLLQALHALRNAPPATTVTTATPGTTATPATTVTTATSTPVTTTTATATPGAAPASPGAGAGALGALLAAIGGQGGLMGAFPAQTATTPPTTVSATTTTPTAVPTTTASGAATAATRERAQQARRTDNASAGGGGAAGGGGGGMGTGGGLDEDAHLRERVRAFRITDRCRMRGFRQLAGGAAYEQLMRTYAVEPYRYATIGAELALRTGILLFGPPGTGKSSFAEAVAVELTGPDGRAAPFYNLTPGDLFSRYLGESERLVRLLFEEARRDTEGGRRPVVVFVDEFEGLFVAGGGGGDAGGGVSAGLRTELNRQLQGVGTENRGIVFLAATNFPEALPPAIVERFLLRLYVGLPDQPVVRQIVQTRLDRMGPARHLFSEEDVLAMVDFLFTGFYSPRAIDGVFDVMAYEAGRRAVDLLTAGDAAPGATYLLHMIRDIASEPHLVSVGGGARCLLMRRDRNAFIPLWQERDNRITEQIGDYRLPARPMTDVAAPDPAPAAPAPGPVRYRVSPTVPDAYRVVVRKRWEPLRADPVAGAYGDAAAAADGGGLARGRWRYEYLLQQPPENPETLLPVGAATFRGMPRLSLAGQNADELPSLVGLAQLRLADFWDATGSVRPVPLTNGLALLRFLTQYGAAAVPSAAGRPDAAQLLVQAVQHSAQVGALSPADTELVNRVLGPAPPAPAPPPRSGTAQIPSPPPGPTAVAPGASPLGPSVPIAGTPAELSQLLQQRAGGNLTTFPFDPATYTLVPTMSTAMPGTTEVAS